MSTRPTTVKPIAARPSTAEMGTQTDVDSSTQTGGTNQTLQELKENIIKEAEQTINATFNQMKACLVEMKRAIESDMDRRDEAIQQNCVTEDTFWYELHNHVPMYALISSKSRSA